MKKSQVRLSNAEAGNVEVSLKFDLMFIELAPAVAAVQGAIIYALEGISV